MLIVCFVFLRAFSFVSSWFVPFLWIVMSARVTFVSNCCGDSMVHIFSMIHLSSLSANVIRVRRSASVIEIIVRNGPYVNTVHWSSLSANVIRVRRSASVIEIIVLGSSLSA